MCLFALFAKKRCNFVTQRRKTRLTYKGHKTQDKTESRMTTEDFKIQYLSLHRRLYALALKALGNSDEAEDAVQTLYLRLWERREMLQEVKERWSYCAKALTNICNDKIRAAGKESDTGLNEDIPCPEENDFETADFEKFIHFYIAQLPDKQQTVMLMRINGATTEEIMDATELSATNIRTILSRVRMELKKLYK